MELSILDWFWTSVSSITISFLLTPVFKKLAEQLKILDWPNQDHKSQIRPIPYLGGAAVASTFALMGILGFTFYPAIFQDEISTLFLFIGPLILFVLGLIDDIKNLSAALRFKIQTAVAALCSIFLYQQELLGSPSGYVILDILLTILWIVGITNAFNLLDNLDGGASGVLLIICVTLAFLSALNNQFLVASIASIVAGSLLGFMFWNVYPARIYLGDAGSLFCGSLVSILCIRFDPQNNSLFTSWASVVVLLSVPILDTTLVFVSRLRRKTSPFVGGRDHMAHRLIQLGYSKRQSAFVIWLLTFLFCVMAVVIINATILLSTIFVALSAIAWIALFFIFLSLPIAEAVSKSKG